MGLKKIIIAGLLGVAVVGIAALGLLFFKGNKEKKILDDQLSIWVTQWKNGDKTAFMEGMTFGEEALPLDMKAESEEKGMVSLDQEALKNRMEEEYGELLEPEEGSEGNETLSDQDIFSVLMAYTDISYKVPSRIKDGGRVVFLITGPDLTGILDQLDLSASPEQWIASVEGLLASGKYTEKITKAEAIIQAMDKGYQLVPGFEMMNALYGGLLDGLKETFLSYGEE